METEDLPAAVPGPVAHATTCGLELTIAEAVARLGVAPRPAQRLAETSRLQIVRRFGRALLLEHPAVIQLARAIGGGRRRNTRTAWAAVELP